VLQADFRGSRGYGQRHYRAGWKQWGRAMQDDLNDGVQHLASHGIVDPQRACIMGASYGGYAALMGVARDPQFWRCAISYAGVTDLELMVKIVYADYSGSRSAEAFHKLRVGDLTEDADMFRTSSPLKMAAQIKRPVLLATGSDDRRVPLENATRMRSALREHGVPHEWVMYDSEIHGFSIDDHAVDFYTRVERFLAQHLGPEPK
jgi:dipeptidyl aminopeptidase/acylaminoacyl peptidase